MKRSPSIFLGAVLLAGPALAQQPPLRHPTLSVDAIQIEPIKREDLFSNVQPISHEILSFDTTHDFKTPEQPRHLDFGGTAESIQSTEVRTDDIRSSFSNIRIEFENPRLQHLNINVQ